MLKPKLTAPILIVLSLAVGLSAFKLSNTDPIDKIATALTNWTSTQPQEKVYLHIDKPYYALGDTLWFKAYVTTGSRHQLSALSGALYADLINEKDSIEKTIKLPLSAGMAKGEFVLSDTLAEGNYRIRAYTQWMRNAGEDYYFDRSFTVGESFDQQLTARAAYQHKIIDGKPGISATIQFSEELNQPLTNREVSYKIKAGTKVIGSKTATTDTAGKISISLSDVKETNIKGLKIQTTFITDSKKRFSKTFAVKADHLQPDVQFFPESGSLINGIESRVGFKVTGIDGNGMTVKGVIADENNVEITRFETLHAGMGRFSLKPEAGKRYKARITLADGTELTADIPKAQEDGYLMSVYNNVAADSLLVRIYTTEKMVQSAAVIALVINAGGEMLYASQVKISRGITTVYVPKKDFPGGIVQFTLFSNNGEPLNEGIAFIKRPDQMLLKLSAPKTSYKTREKVQIVLAAQDRQGKPVGGNFSVAVIDEGKVPIDEASEHTILSDLLLTADIKGYVEKPNYYFLNQDEETETALDNLMLTQGYRRFAWKAILSGQAEKPSFKAEKINTEIAGRLLTLSNKPVAKGKITLFSANTGIILDTVTDAEGHFSFDKLILTDSIKFTVQGRSPKNGSNVQIFLDKIPPQLITVNKNTGELNTDITGSRKVYLENSKKQLDVLAKTGRLNRIQQLRQVNITGNRANVNYAAQGTFVVPDINADKVYVIENPESYPNLLAAFQGRLAGVTFGTYEGVQNWPMSRGDPMQIIVDGVRMSNREEAAEILSGAIDPADVAKVQVVRTGLAIANMLDDPTVPKKNGGPIGSILIITKRGTVRKSYNPSVAITLPKGFNKVKEFYSPRYDHPQNSVSSTDFRSTIYWNPDIKTKADGNAVIDFYNADNPGSYKVIVEGINAAGELGRQVYRFKVE